MGSLLIGAIFLLANAVLSATLYVRHRTAINRALLTMWLASLLNFVALVPLINQPYAVRALALVMGYPVTASLAWLLLLAQAYPNKPSFRARVLIPLFIGGFVLACIAALAGAPDWLTALPLSIGVNAPLLFHGGRAVLCWRRLDNPTVRILAVITFLVGLHGLDFAFVYNWTNPTVNAIGFLIAFVLIMSMSVFANAAALEKQVEERVRLEANRKYEALSRMAAGVAHEINNPLAIILLQSEQLMPWVKGTSAESRMGAGFQRIEEMVQRIGRITSALWDLTTVAARISAVPVSVNELLGTVHHLSRSRFDRSGARFNVELLDSDPRVFCQRGEIVRVLLNLIDNAFDALMELQDGDRWVTLTASVEWPFVRFRVADSGEGVSPGAAAHLFDPFFTGKEFGKGVGLGLSVAKGLVEANGGHLSYDGKVPHTQFSFTVPLVDGERE